jgi:transcriptional regulator with XRE-family HTH domain
MPSPKPLWRIDGALIRTRRTERGMTKAALASMAGISERALTNIELGRSPGSSESARTLASALDLPLEQVLVAATSGERSSADEASREATPIATAIRPPAKLPAQTRLDFLADLERAHGIDPPPVRVGKESFEVLTATRLQCAFATHALFDGHRYVVEGTVDRMRAVKPEEAAAIGAKVGVGARFHLVRDVIAGEPIGVTVHVTTGKLATALQAKMKREVRLVVRLVVVSRDDARLISVFVSDTKRAWGLIVARVVG